MIDVLVVGAGAQGGPCASILAGETGVGEIRLGDIDLALAEKVTRRIKDDRVVPMKLDASSIGQVSAAAKGVDVIINLAHLKFNPVIMRAAIQAGTHYVDTATTTAFLEHWISGGE